MLRPWRSVSPISDPVQKLTWHCPCDCNCTVGPKSTEVHEEEQGPGFVEHWAPFQNTELSRYFCLRATSVIPVAGAELTASERLGLCRTRGGRHRSHHHAFHAASPSKVALERVPSAEQFPGFSITLLKISLPWLLRKILPAGCMNSVP